MVGQYKKNLKESQKADPDCSVAPCTFMDGYFFPTYTDTEGEVKMTEEYKNAINIPLLNTYVVSLLTYLHCRSVSSFSTCGKGVDHILL